MPPVVHTPDPRNAVLWPDPRAQSNSVQQVEEIFAGRVGTGFQASYHRDYVRKFRVLLKEAPLIPIEKVDDTDIFSDSRVPRPFASYFSNWQNAAGASTPEALYASVKYADVHALAVQHSAEREFPDDPLTWILTVNYTTNVPENGPDYRFMFGGTQLSQDTTNPKSPTFKPWYQMPTIEWQSAESTVAKQWDANGKPFLNSAGQPFAPAPTMEIAYPILHITRNEQIFGADQFTYWSFAVNDGAFMGFPQDCVQVLPPSVKQLWWGPQKYFRTTWRLRFKPEEYVNWWNADEEEYQTARVSWQQYTLDCGFYQLTDPGAGPQTVVPIVRNGHRIGNQPALLDGQGRLLPRGDDPVYVYNQTRQRRNFLTLFNNDPTL